MTPYFKEDIPRTHESFMHVVYISPCPVAYGWTAPTMSVNLRSVSVNNVTQIVNNDCESWNMSTICMKNMLFKSYSKTQSDTIWNRRFQIYTFSSSVGNIQFTLTDTCSSMCMLNARPTKNLTDTCKE